MVNPTAAKTETAEEIEQSWHSDRWTGLGRAYTAVDVFARTDAKDASLMTNDIDPRDDDIDPNRGREI